MSFIFSFEPVFAEDSLWSGAVSVVRTLRGHSFKAFFAGGAVRDMLLGKKPHDIDIATSALPEEIQRIFDHTHDVGVSFGVVTVHTGTFQYEVASFRGERGYADGRRPDGVFYSSDESLDVERRDFTVNGLLYDPLSRTVHDHVGGIADLRRGVLRTIGDPMRRFSEDYLRILRAVRFTASLRFELDSSAEYAMTVNSAKLSRLSAERIRSELERILLGNHPGNAFRLMARTGILRAVLPEIHALQGVEQPVRYHPEGDVFEHTMIMLEHMAHPTPELAWSVLLHDVGKPATFFRGPDGVPRFYGHEAAGAVLAERILRRLKAPSVLTERVRLAVAGHMRFASVDKMKKSTWMKILASSLFPTEMELHRIDCVSCHGITANWLLMLDRYGKIEETPALAPPLLKGGDLIGIGFPPGPGMGALLNKIRDLQLEGVLNNREDALEFAKKEIPHA